MTATTTVAFAEALAWSLKAAESAYAKNLAAMPTESAEFFDFDYFARFNLEGYLRSQFRLRVLTLAADAGEEGPRRLAMELGMALADGSRSSDLLGAGAERAKADEARSLVSLFRAWLPLDELVGRLSY